MKKLVAILMVMGTLAHGAASGYRPVFYDGTNIATMTNPGSPQVISPSPFVATNDNRSLAFSGPKFQVARGMDVLSTYYIYLGSNSKTNYDVSASTDVGGVAIKPSILNTTNNDKNYGVTIKATSLADATDRELIDQIALYIENTQKGSNGVGKLNIRNVYGALIAPMDMGSNNNCGLRIYSPTGYSAVANYGLFVDSPTNSLDNVGIYNAGTLRQLNNAYVSGSLKVGVTTNANVSKLDVVTQGNTDVLVKNLTDTIGGTASVSLAVSSGETVGGFGSRSVTMAATRQTGSYFDWGLWVSDASASVERIRVKGNSGNVGIGTNTPVGPLHVSANNGSNYLVVAANGYTGIGTNVPAYQLDVAGNGRIIGTLNVKDTLTVASEASYMPQIIGMSYGANSWPYYLFYKARGTLASPSVSSNGDYLAFPTYVSGYATNGWQNVGYWMWAQVGEAGTNYINGTVKLILNVNGIWNAPFVFTTNALSINTAGADPTTTLDVGGTIRSTSGGLRLGVGSGAIPSSITNYAQLFTTNSAAAELYVMDGAGNQTKLSTHEGLKHVAESWNVYTGEGRSIDLDELAATVQQLSGKTNIVRKITVPRRDWDAEQEQQVQDSIKAQLYWEERYAHTPNPTDKSQPQKPPRPVLHKKQPKPDWLKEWEDKQ